jgi:serine/threonine protein phosphatase PrpC
MPGDRILVGGIGDGLVLVSSPDGQVTTVGLDERDFTSETQALGISRSVLDWEFQEAAFPAGSIALVATDGVSDDLRRDRLADFARDLVARCAPLRPQARAAALRRILQAWPTPAHTDDLTLALMWHVEATNER